MKARGSVLVAVLLVAAIFFLMGAAMLVGNSSSYRAAVLYAASTQARQLALSGLEDARIKLMKDQHFPPPGAVDQTVFGYAENVVGAEGEVVGRYEVQVDTSRAVTPYMVIVVQSVGSVVRDGEVLARRQMIAEIDVAVTERGGTDANPFLFEIVHFRDEGSLSRD